MSTRDWPCLAARADGSLRLSVVVTPHARRTAADGLHDGALRVRLAAPPIDGRANAAIVAWLADELGCPRRAVTLERGASTRRKTLAISAPAAGVRRWLDRVLGPPSGDAGAPAT